MPMCMYVSPNWEFFETPGKETRAADKIGGGASRGLASRGASAMGGGPEPERQF